MISVKSRSELEKMRKAGIIAGNALHFGGQSIKVGMTTYELDKIIHDYIVKHGCNSLFPGIRRLPRFGVHFDKQQGHPWYPVQA